MKKSLGEFIKSKSIVIGVGIVAAICLADFEVGTDRIVIVGATFSGDLGLRGGTLSSDAFFSDSAAVNENNRFGYNSSTGQVLFDADGSGAGGAEVLLTLENIPTGFSNADIVVL